MIQVKNISKTFQHVHAVENVSFHLQEHAITALLGANGAGKTTLLSMIARLLKPTNGTVELKGTIGFLPQYPKFFDTLTAYEFLYMCGQVSDVKNLRERIEVVLQLVGLTDAMHKRAATFSGGMKQRLGIAQAILHEPTILVLDEPVSALDPIGRREVMQLLFELKQSMTILYSTHVLSDAEQIADDVLLMHEGKLVKQSALAELKQQYVQQTVQIELVDAKQLNELMPHVTPVHVEDARLEVTETMPQVLAILAKLDIDVVKVERTQQSLEQIFMKVVQS